MSEPATKADLAALEARMDQRTDRLEAEVGANRTAIDANGAAIDANRAEILTNRTAIGANGNAIAELRREVAANRDAIHGLERRLSWEIAHSANAITEVLRDGMRVLDEKYADLPARVRALEERNRD